ncbi:MAG: hypothetical protein SWQ30_07805 [Thermodesulfobacteriota bacterium]|nr:hypothetical protein [Thermodesulfobacteriota bacterium]
MADKKLHDMFLLEDKGEWLFVRICRFGKVIGEGWALAKEFQANLQVYPIADFITTKDEPREDSPVVSFASHNHDYSYFLVEEAKQWKKVKLYEGGKYIREAWVPAKELGTAEQRNTWLSARPRLYIEENGVRKVFWSDQTSSESRRAKASGYSSSSSLHTDRVWSSNDFGYALVTYTNNSSKTFESVTIKCVALDSAGNKLAVNSRSFLALEYGPIRPGFSDTIEIPVSLEGATMSSMRCRCLER